MKLGGQEREFRFGINANRALIKATGKTPMELVQDGFDPTDFDIGVHIIWAGLLWSNRKLTPDLVGQWLDAEDAKQPGAYVKAVSEATSEMVASFERSFGTGEDEEEEEDPEKN
jgi:hypothetical protein